MIPDWDALTLLLAGALAAGWIDAVIDGGGLVPSVVDEDQSWATSLAARATPPCRGLA